MMPAAAPAIADDDGVDESPPRRYCVACEATWAKGACPVCGDVGVPGRPGHEPAGWPQLRVPVAPFVVATRPGLRL